MVGAALCGRPMSVKCLCFGRPHRGAPTVFFLLLFFSSLLVHAEPAIKIVNGRVKEVRVRDHQLILSVKHPATGETKELVLQIDERTGFKKGIHLGDFHPDDPVSADYEETSGGNSRAIQIRQVPLKGVPDEIRRPKI